MKISILLYHSDWDLNVNKFTITEGIRLENFKKSKMLSIYEKSCYNLDFDDGDPFDIFTHILIDDSIIRDNHGCFEWNSPYSIISMICNVIFLLH